MSSYPKDGVMLIVILITWIVIFQVIGCATLPLLEDSSIDIAVSHKPANSDGK